MISASVRRRLMLLVFGSITVILSITLVGSYRAATREVDEWDVARLIQIARMLATLDQNDLSALARTGIDTRVEFPESGAVSNDGDSDKQPRSLLFQVSEASGHITGNAEIAALSKSGPTFDLASGVQVLKLGNRQWHGYTLRDETSGRTVLVVEPSNDRSDLATGIARRVGRPFLLALPVLALFVWLSISNSLSSLPIDRRLLFP